MKKFLLATAILVATCTANAAAPVTLATIQSGGVTYHRPVPAGSTIGQTVKFIGIGRLGVPAVRSGKITAIGQ